MARREAKLLISDYDKSEREYLRNEISRMNRGKIYTASNGIETLAILEQHTPDILVLDDSSSALDYRTDADLRLALARDYSDVTSVLVSSRVSSIAHCTRILMLDEGRVIGAGTHEELMKSCPAYLDIARTQMGGDRCA